MSNEIKLKASDEAGLRRELKTLVFNGAYSAGIPDLEREVWDRMPVRFRLLYELVWLRAFGASVGGRHGGVVTQNVVHGAKRVTRVSSGQTETRGGAHSGKKLVGASDKDVISNASALAMLRRVDRRLRQVARDMDVYLHAGAADKVKRRCSVCKKFGDDEWLYCPRDGRPMEQVE
jgi:hypothetical protein